MVGMEREREREGEREREREGERGERERRERERGRKESGMSCCGAEHFLFVSSWLIDSGNVDFELRWFVHIPDLEQETRGDIERWWEWREREREREGERAKRGIHIYIYIYATGLICGPPKRVSRVNLRPPMG